MLNVLGGLMVIVMRIANVFEVKELAENRDNYSAYQGVLIVSAFGLILAMFLSLFEGFSVNKEVFLNIVLYSTLWLAASIASFELVKRLNLVTYTAIWNLILPMTIIIDILFGNIDSTPRVLLGGFLIISAVVVVVIRDNAIQIKGLKSIMYLILIIGIVILQASIHVTMHYILGISGVVISEVLLIRSVFGLVMLILLMSIWKKFSLKNIERNKKSHFKAGSYSLVQQYLSIVVLKYLPATYFLLLKNLTSYLVVPVSKRSNDVLIKKVDPHAHWFFIINFIGALLIML